MNPPTYENLKIYDITPIHSYDGILYKRDDLYTPFADNPISGGKIRQVCCLFLENYDKIKNEFNSSVVTGTSVNSPQGIVVARAAKEFGFKSLIVFGATKRETLMRNIMVRWMQHAGAEFDYKSKLAYDNVLNARIREIQRVRNLFHVKFGINLENNPDAIINSTAYQVQNLPDELDNLIIPTGSAITAGGILVGLKQYNKKVKRVIIVQISGYDRRDTLREIFNQLNINPHPYYEYVADKTFPYSRQLRVRFNEDEFLDPVYEAKGYYWMRYNINTDNQKTVFWIIGNSYYVRTVTPEMIKVNV